MCNLHTFTNELTTTDNYKTIVAQHNKRLAYWTERPCYASLLHENGQKENYYCPKINDYTPHHTKRTANIHWRKTVVRDRADNLSNFDIIECTLKATMNYQRQRKWLQGTCVPAPILPFRTSNSHSSSNCGMTSSLFLPNLYFAYFHCKPKLIFRWVLFLLYFHRCPLRFRFFVTLKQLFAEFYL